MRAVRSAGNGGNPASHPGLGEPPELLERRARKQRAERSGGARAPRRLGGLSVIIMVTITRPQEDNFDSARLIVLRSSFESTKKDHL